VQVLLRSFPEVGRRMDQERVNRDIANARRELLAVENMLRTMRGEPPLSFLPEQCGFCARSEAEAGALAEGLGVYICEGCADSALRKIRGNEG
jgi:hypothetical protein